MITANLSICSDYLAVMADDDYIKSFSIPSGMPELEKRLRESFPLDHIIEESALSTKYYNNLSIDDYNTGKRFEFIYGTGYKINVTENSVCFNGIISDINGIALKTDKFFPCSFFNHIKEGDIIIAEIDGQEYQLTIHQMALLPKEQIYKYKFEDYLFVISTSFAGVSKAPNKVPMTIQRARLVKNHQDLANILNLPYIDLQEYKNLPTGVDVNVLEHMIDFYNYS